MTEMKSQVYFSNYLALGVITHEECIKHYPCAYTFQVLYEFGNDHDSSYVEIVSTIADLDLQDEQCPLLLKSICDQQTYRPMEKK